MPDDNNTLGETKAWLQARMRDGVKCPCCTQLAKIYRRTITSQMALWLMWLVRETAEAPDGWVDIKTNIDLRGGDYAKLRYWGLLEHQTNDDPAKRSSGLWRPTPVAVAFVQDRVRLHKHVLIFDDQFLSFDGDAMIGIREALGKKFNYEELMRG